MVANIELKSYISKLFYYKGGNMWEILYSMLTKIVLYATISLGTVEKIMEGKDRKGDKLALFQSVTKIARLSSNIYMVLNIFLRRTREPYRCYYKYSADKVTVGDVGLITDHAQVSNAFIPLAEALGVLADNLFENKLVDKFYRKQRTFGMYHVGHKTYAGRAIAMRLCVSPDKIFRYLRMNSHIIGERVHVIIHDIYVEAYFTMSIKKGESAITTNPPLCGLPAKHQLILPAEPTSQKEVNVLL